MLLMVLCEREGRVYDVLITFGSVHVVRAFRERKKWSLWFRGRVENCVVYGVRGYWGCEGVIVCDSKDMWAKRQVVEGVISQIKLFNAGSGWRTLTCVLVYVYAYAIGYSYYTFHHLPFCPHLPTTTHNHTFTTPIAPISIHHTILHKPPKP